MPDQRREKRDHGQRAGRPRQFIFDFTEAGEQHGIGYVLAFRLPREFPPHLVARLVTCPAARMNGPQLI